MRHNGRVVLGESVPGWPVRGELLDIAFQVRPRNLRENLVFIHEQLYRKCVCGTNVGVSFVIRLAQREDAPYLCEIYNHAVRTTTATLETQERDLATQIMWLAQHDGQPYPCFVAEDREGLILGWASLSPYNPKPGYRRTAEDSVYVDVAAQGSGIGQALLQALLDAAPERGIQTIIALITSDNTVSLRLHEKLGFTRVGTLERVGHKFGRDVDVTLLQWHTP